MNEPVANSEAAPAAVPATSRPGDVSGAPEGLVERDVRLDARSVDGLSVERCLELSDALRARNSYLAELKAYLAEQHRIERHLKHRGDDEESGIGRVVLKLVRWGLGQPRPWSEKSVLTQIAMSRAAAGRAAAVAAVAVLVVALYLAHCEAREAFRFATEHLVFVPKSGVASVSQPLLDYKLQVVLARLTSIALMTGGALWFSLRALGIAKDLFMPGTADRADAKSMPLLAQLEERDPAQMVLGPGPLEHDPTKIPEVAEMLPQHPDR